MGGTPSVTTACSLPQHANASGRAWPALCCSVPVEALARLPMPPADVPLVAAIQALEAQPKP